MRYHIERAVVVFASISTMFFVIGGLKAAPVDEIPEDISLVVYENSDVGLNGYRFTLKKSDDIDEGDIPVEGGTWVNADGNRYTLKYIPDQNSSLPEGEHLPVVTESNAKISI